MMKWRMLTAPADEPIVLADVERQTRITDLSDESTEIGLFIQSVRQRAEAVTRRALMTQQWEVALDAFPCGRKPIELPLPPLQSVDSIIYTDPSGVEQTMDPALYRVVTDNSPTGQPGQIVPVYGSTWPLALNDMAVVRIQFTCGYGAEPGDVPAAIRQWILLNVASLYENREAQTVASGRLMEVDLSTMADGLIADFRVYGW